MVEPCYQADISLMIFQVPWNGFEFYFPVAGWTYPLSPATFGLHPYPKYIIYGKIRQILFEFGGLWVERDLHKVPKLTFVTWAAVCQLLSWIILTWLFPSAGKSQWSNQSWLFTSPQKQQMRKREGIALGLPVIKKQLRIFPLYSNLVYFNPETKTRAKGEVWLINDFHTLLNL